MKKDIGHLRKVYEKGSLDESNVGSDPMLLFKKWFNDAEAIKTIDEPNAFSLSTIGVDGFPKSRIVLLKSYDSDGFVFYTNYNSNKGIDILNNPKVGLSFFWPKLERQVIIKGTASKISEFESDKYFNSRPIANRLGAIVSNQSQVIPNRKILEEQFHKIKKAYRLKEPQRPKNWGGFKVCVVFMEFWQGRPNRLHDRIVFQKLKNKWSISRLSP